MRCPCFRAFTLLSENFPAKGFKILPIKVFDCSCCRNTYTTPYSTPYPCNIFSPRPAGSWCYQDHAGGLQSGEGVRGSQGAVQTRGLTTQTAL